MQDIVKSITINAPLLHVWSYLSEREKFEKWMLTMSGAPTLGETFYFRMTAAKDSEWDGEIKCHVTRMEPPNRLEFSWSHNELAFAETLVSISLAEVAGGTEVTLVHSGWDAIANEALRAYKHSDHNEGWDNHLRVWDELATGVSDKSWMDRGGGC